MTEHLHIGCAGWSVPGAHAAHFPEDGTHLARYARRFNMVEINSSFYRPHQPKTYAKWAACVPDNFRFAVKFPRAGTHDARLHEAEPIIESFASQVHELGDRLGPVLVQLPPSLAFERDVAEVFFDAMRQHFDGPLVCEPRHPTWFTPAGDALWKRFDVARVAADPARVPEAAIAGGAGPVRYWRLHGAPRVYYDAYGDEGLRPWAGDIRAAREAGLDCWAVMDNTALGHATLDAMRLEAMLADVR
ncbi:DUF72 domain-containing protein [Cognatilysobacter terrigena]|uniref:DUF72 domain-containing protein n=1 Tax=Cognatilysobacter terrigena TaxID=2488749 RepID=UPI00105B9CA3|nr:DUF72 domain-containing protein [Lysobacter terrigena]